MFKVAWFARFVEGKHPVEVRRYWAGIMGGCA
jgi:hypothetical protein